MIGPIADLLKLGEREREYFALLVKYNHCTAISEREILFKQLNGFQKEKTLPLKPEQYQLFTQWYYIAIRELLRIMPFSDDFQRLSVLLRPKIRSKEARKAIETLQKIGLIACGEDGCFKPVEVSVTTGDDWVSELIKNVQIQLAEMGKNAIVAIPKQERDISNLTFCASEETMCRIAGEIDLLRQKILAMSENDSAANTVYQCNMQLFPISHKTREAKQ